MVFRETDESRILKEKTRVAVSLAMEGNWSKAVITNREILNSSPDNVESLNRLGKALIELNQFDEAFAAFTKVLSINPGNTIAAKNINRLNWANANKSDGNPPANNSAGSLSAKFFIGQSGKSAEVTLSESSINCDPSPGTPITLAIEGSAIVALDQCSNRLGYVPSKLSRRLICLINGGNKYDGAISGRSEGALRAILRECHQDPNQRSKISFPSSSSWNSTLIEENVQIERNAEIINPLRNMDQVLETDQDPDQLILVGAGIHLEDNADDDLLIEDLEEEITN